MSEQAVNLTLADRILFGIVADIPTMIWSLPGMGKTTTVNLLAKSMEIHCETVIANLREPTDFNGYPFEHNGEVKISKPWLVSKLEKYSKGILFFDELPTALRATQNALLRVILERKSGDYDIPSGFRVVAAGNFVDVAGNIHLSSAMANRLYHINHDPTVQEFIEASSSGIVFNSTIKDDWEDQVPHYESILYTFVENRPDLLKNIPDGFDQVDDYAFCTPRSLMMAARMLAVTDGLYPSVTKGIIGGTATSALFEYMKSIDQTYNFLRIDLDNFDFPSNPSQTMVLVQSAAIYAKQPALAEKAIRLFKMADEAGFKPASQRFSIPLAQNLVSHMPIQKIIEELPFVRRNLGARSF